MGLVSTLGYELSEANAVQRVVQRIAASAPGSWVFQRTLHPVDRLLFRLTSGRVTVPGLLAGLPVIMLTTTGAKSGLERTMPLVGVPHDDDLAVIGSNFGQRSTPGWVFNLRATPEATVSFGAESVRVTARPASDDETERVFERGAGFYGGFPQYRERAAHRDIQVFVLEPVTNDPSS